LTSSVKKSKHKITDVDVVDEQVGTNSWTKMNFIFSKLLLML
jgi:hypothetical protein